MFRLRLLAAILLPALLAVAPVRADDAFPRFSNYVVDQADVIPPADEQALIAKLKAFRDKTGHQFAVATVTSLGGTSVEDYGNRLFRAWGIGDKTRNDGALLLIAPNERKVRIEVGYGLEGDLTDAVASLIIQHSILPRFKAGDIPGGVARGADDIMAVFSGQAEDYKARALQSLTEKDMAPWWVEILIILAMIAVFAFIFWVLWRSMKAGGGRGGRSGPWIVGGPSSGGWSGGSSSGGGFSGGGGGSSGGGGASGGW